MATHTACPSANPVFFEARDVSIGLPLLSGHAEMTSGTARITAWIPTPPVETEWHFDTDLLPAPDSTGSARLGSMDDPAFAPMPLGNTPGVTQAQSAFGTTTGFGISDIAGSEATVYRVSPPRDLTNPLSTDRSRSIGIAAGDWIDTTTDHTDPRYGDGEVVNPADWSAWGAFPNPWATSSGGALMAGTSALFAAGCP